MLPPIETYEINGKQIFVVRDDIPFPFPSPNFSKIRGLDLHLKNKASEGIKNVAVQDTIMSRCGWGTSYICKKYGLKCYNFYPVRKDGPDFYRKMSKSFGATTIPIMGTRQKIARVIAKRWFEEQGIDDYYFLPIGISLKETITEHVRLIEKLPRELFTGTIISCISSGTIFSGLLSGLIKQKLSPTVHGVQIHTWKNRRKVIDKKVDSYNGYQSKYNPLSFTNRIDNFRSINYDIIDLGYDYIDYVNEPVPPFPCNRYLDRKAWVYLLKSAKHLKDPIVFWNIGGEWNPQTGIGDGLRGDGNVTEEDIRKHLGE